MRVLILSWEYPPLVVGGLGRHVDGLSRGLAAAGHDVVVLTRGEAGAPAEEIRDGVRVHRSTPDPLAIGFTTESLLAWAQAAEHSLLRTGLPLTRRWRPDVIHAHDWLVAQSAITLAQSTATPLVVTMHATEAGRLQGWLPRPLNLAIHSVERWLVHAADAVITCSEAMHGEVVRLFQRPDGVAVVPNGIDPDRWQVPAKARRAARMRLGRGDPLLVYAGRLVPEKGLDLLVDALPELRRRHPGLRLVVAGSGSDKDRLHDLARRRRVARAVDWLGFLPEPELAAVIAAADAVVVPSRYEPFGLVALEAAAAGAPVVLADTGGLHELVAAGIGTPFAPGDVDGLTRAVRCVLEDAATARRSVARARRSIRRDYSWGAVADHTAAVYDDVIRSAAPVRRPRTTQP